MSESVVIISILMGFFVCVYFFAHTAFFGALLGLPMTGSGDIALPEGIDFIIFYALFGCMVFYFRCIKKRDFSISAILKTGVLLIGGLAVVWLFTRIPLA